MTTTELSFEQWEIPAERPPQATGKFIQPSCISNTQYLPSGKSNWKTPHIRMCTGDAFSIFPRESEKELPEK